MTRGRKKAGESGSSLLPGANGSGTIDGLEQGRSSVNGKDAKRLRADRNSSLRQKISENILEIVEREMGSMGATQKVTMMIDGCAGKIVRVIDRILHPLPAEKCVKLRMVREIINHTGWSQRELADRVEVEENTVSRWLKGQTVPAGGRLKRVRNLHDWVMSVNGGAGDKPK